MIDPKKSAALIVSGIGPEDHGDEGEGGEVSMIADELMEGIHAKDHAKVCAALEALCEYVRAQDVEPSSEDEDSKYGE